MSLKIANLRSKSVALGRLLTTSDADFQGYMDTYEALFTDSPENTKEDYDRGVPIKGYKQGSSPELEQYYKLIHLMCTLGSVEKMYLPPVMDAEESVTENQNLFERQLAEDIDVDAESTVLDLGCGCGAIAAHIGELRGCTMYGINIERSQIEKARKNPLLANSQFCFQVGDFNHALDFEDGIFDAVYNVQALTYATDLDFTLKQAFRILKPGGKIVINDVAALDNYDRGNERHKRLVQHTRELTGFGGLWHYKYWEEAFEKAGFDLISSSGKSALEMIRKERALYDRFNRVASALSKMHLIPQKVDMMLQRMNTNCESYIQAEEEELVTLNWKVVAEKPLQSFA